MRPDRFRVRAPAKINLLLHVLGVRPDGYHDLRTVFQSVALHDTLAFHFRPGPFRLRCDDPACPPGPANLVWQAAERLWRAAELGGPPRDVEVTLVKRIPARAGLGGGSSDAAAALRGLAAGWRLERREGVRLRELAAALGADVPYFLEGGTVLGLERGEVLFPLVDHPAAWVILAFPRAGVSTAEAYGWWDRAPTRRGRAARPAADLRNDLQPAVARRHPVVARLVERLVRAGAAHAAMSGSGSAVFGLFARRADADRARRALHPARTVLTRLLSRAAYQRLAGLAGHRIHLPFAPRGLGHS